MCNTCADFSEFQLHWQMVLKTISYNLFYYYEMFTMVRHCFKNSITTWCGRNPALESEKGTWIPSILCEYAKTYVMQITQLTGASVYSCVEGLIKEMF